MPCPTVLMPLAIILALGTVSPLIARPIDAARAARFAPDPPEGFQPALSAATGLLCVKQCPNDDLPCDPPSFKAADGRCSTQWR